MKTTEWRWKSADGLEMYSYGWTPEGKTKAVVILVHGLGEHVKRYSHVAAAFEKHGYALMGFDLRGHGKSGGPRGHTPSVDAIFDDLDSFISQVEVRFPKVPKFLYGHSLGGLLILAYTPSRHPKVSGVIATGSAIATAIERQKVKLVLAKILGTLAPTFSMPSGLDPNTLSRDSKVVEAYKADPLVHDRITTGFGKVMLNVVALTKKLAPIFPVPVLVMHGAVDQLTFPSGSQEFAALAPKDKCTLKIWDGLRHEIHNEPEQEQVFKFMINWMDQQK
jgi:acylglycerol lipase